MLSRLANQSYVQLSSARSDDRHYRDGKWWIWNTYAGWQDNFSFWSIPTIRRTVSSLRAQDLILIDRFNLKGYDRTNWYAIDYDALAALQACDQPDLVLDWPSPSDRNDPLHTINLIPPMRSTCSHRMAQIDPTQRATEGPTSPPIAVPPVLESIR
jgi:hypothetical protein